MQPLNLSTPVKTLKSLAGHIWLPGYFLIAAWMLSIPFAYSQDADPVTEENEEASELQSSSSSSSETPLYPNRATRDKTLIAKAAGEQAQWLDTDHGQILAFYRPTEARETRGVLVLFHAAEDPQTWPPILENLRANLPRFGWETLAITLPQKSPGAIPPRPSSSSSSVAEAKPEEEQDGEEQNGKEQDEEEQKKEPEENPAAEEQSSTVEAVAEQSSSSAPPAIPREELIAAYVKAAFAFLEEKALLNAVILVDNSSAAPVLSELIPQVSENPENPDTLDGPIQALVITNVQSQEPLTTGELTTIFGNPKLPVLDVFFTPDNAEQKQARDRHRAVGMRQKLEVYQQIALDGQPKIVETDPRSFLAARVRGFMQRYADGMETRKGKEPQN